MSALLLELTGLEKIYGHGESEVRALDGIDLAVREGEFLAVMGATFAYMLDNEARSNARRAAFDQALYTAESGVEDVLYQRTKDQSNVCFPFAGEGTDGTITGAAGGEKCTFCFLVCAIPFINCRLAWHTASMEKNENCNSNLPASILERSSISLIRSRRWRPLSSIVDIVFCCKSFNSPKVFCCMASERPRIPVRGVRNSWLMLARNSSLDRSARAKSELTRLRSAVRSSTCISNSLAY